MTTYAFQADLPADASFGRLGRRSRLGHSTLTG
jgi:hypothetical protein